MSLAVGSRLGPYEIVAPLGAGGMGEVYRARDTRLGRDVAVKIISSCFAADGDQLRRFEREARAASQLDHSNILVVHDVGSHEGSPYIVSELLDGESLRDKLGEPLLPKKALDYALQVAQGLAAAHEKGIVHRDLKPENLFVTKDGRVKILDFGIAKLTQQVIPSASLTEAPTAARATDAGVLLGTVAYMSPEQARGNTVDFRSDQFSFGVVLYEMLTGRRPFARPSAAETLAAIIREEPELVTKLAPGVPAILGWVVQRCLSKDPEERYSSTRDLAKELQDLRTHFSEAVGTLDTTPAEPSRHRGRIPVWLSAAVVVLVVALGLLLGIRILQPGSPAARPISLTLSFPVDAAPYTGNTNSLALSPDGKTLVYAGWSGGETHLFVRSIDRDEIKQIPETEGAHYPFFSPDGQWIGFFAKQQLKKLALAGGSPIALCDAANTRGGSWGADGTIVFAPSPRAGLQRVAALGGEPRNVVTPEAGKGEGYYHPDVLPDGDNVLFQIASPDRKSRVAVVSLRTRERRILLEDAAYPRYLPTGHLLFTRSGLLYAAPFSLQRLETAGPPVPVVQNALTNRYGKEVAEVACSREGTLVYVPYRQPQRTLVWVDRKGAIEKAPFPPGGYSQVALSPDAGRLAAVSTGKAEEQSLVIGDFARGALTRAGAKGKFLDLAWAPDGKRLAFGFAPDGERLWRVFWQSADGSAAPERLGSETRIQQESPTSFSPDGAVLLVQVAKYASTRVWETFVLPIAGDSRLRGLFQTAFDVRDARFSPDGRRVAYYSDESGRYEVYVQPYPGPGPKWQISTEGGTYPRWSRSGRELFYQNGGRMMAVDVETTPTFRAGRPQLLFEGGFFSDMFWETNNYDVAPDGARFLMIRPDPAESGPAHVNVILNWFEEVKRRVPGTK